MSLLADVQGIAQPLIAAEEESDFFLRDAEPPAPLCCPDFLSSLFDIPSRNRTIAVVGNLHAGKTSFIDTLFRAAYAELPDFDPQRPHATPRRMFTRRDEPQRGITVALSAVTLALPDITGQTLAVTLLDTPGHRELLDDVPAALRLADAALLCVDACEGVMDTTSDIIRACVRESLPVTVAITKVDRLITDVRLSPAVAAAHLHSLVASVRDALEAERATTALSGHHGPQPPISPTDGSVIFSSGRHGWLTSLPLVAERMAVPRGSRPRSPAPDTQQMANRLWGEWRFDAANARFVLPGASADNAVLALPRTFATFVLDPIWKLYTAVLAEDASALPHLLAPVGISLSKHDLALDTQPLLARVLQQFAGHPAPLVRLCVRLAPPSREQMLRRCVLAELSNPSTDAPLIAVSRLLPRAHGEFGLLARVISGSVAPGDQLLVSYGPDDVDTVQISQVLLCDPRGDTPLQAAPVGTTVILLGADLSGPALLFSGSPPSGSSLVPTARPIIGLYPPTLSLPIEALERDRPEALLTGLSLLSRAWPSLGMREGAAGSHLLIGHGELHLELAMHDLRELYARSEVRVACPLPLLAEGPTDDSALIVTGSSPDSTFHVRVIVTPLPARMLAALDAGATDAFERWDRHMRRSFFCGEFGWSHLEADRTWAVASDKRSGLAAILRNEIISSRDGTVLDIPDAVRSSLTSGFRWAANRGPLASSPIRGALVRLVGLESPPVAPVPASIAAAMRFAVHGAAVLAQPAIYEPVLVGEATLPPSSLRRLQQALATRRGTLLESGPIPTCPYHYARVLIPALDSLGFEADLRMSTLGKAFVQKVFSHWERVPGDPLDTSLPVPDLEAARPAALPRELSVKSRRRLGLPDDLVPAAIFSDAMLIAVAECEESCGASLL
jgi:U5 small nuclear ribonucleoprotein component